MLGVDREGLAAVGGGENREAQRSQHARAQGPDGLFIIHQQDGALSLPIVGARVVLPGRATSKPSLSGKEDLEGGALARLAVEPERALVAADDAQHRGQAQASARELGGEEGLEEVLLRLRIHARPVSDTSRVRYRPGAGFPLDRRSCQVLAEHSVTPVEMVMTPLCSPMASEALITRFMTTWRSWLASPRHGRQVPAQIEIEERLLGDRALEQVEHVLDERSQVDGFDHEVAPPGVREHLPAEIGGPAGGLP